MEYVYLVATLVMGAWLYRRRPGLYVGFAWWLWFITPGVRRLVDYVQGWDPINPIMLAPYLVSLLTLFALLHHLPKLLLNRFFPFVLIFAGLFYAFAVGIYRGEVFSASYQLLEWLVPVVFACYLVVHWRKYPVYRKAVQHTFAFAVPVIGAYGLVQFFYPLPWDRYWMTNSSMISIGEPEPFGVRLFSTLNSPSPFAMVMMAGLLLLLSGGGLSRWPAAAIGYASFLLSLSRQAWGGWLAGLLFIIMRRGRSQLGLLVTLAVTALVALPLLTVGPVAERINERLGTLTNIQDDRSFQARVELYEEFLPQAFFNPVGEGFGSTGLSTKLNAGGEGISESGDVVGIDSGILEMPFTLGWLGTALYLGGLGWLLYYAFRGRKSEDLFATVSCGIVVSMLSQLPFNDKMEGFQGMLLWTFIALAIASKAYHNQASKDEGSGAEPEGGDRYAGPEEVAREGAAGSTLVRSSGNPWR